MTKADKHMGLKSARALKREPILEPHKTPKKVSKRKPRPYVLEERIKMAFSRNREWIIKHRYASAISRAQAHKKLERSCWRADTTTFVEYEE